MKILFLALDVNLGTNRGDSVHTRNLAAFIARPGHSVHLVVGANSRHPGLPGVDVSVPPGPGDLSVLSHVRKVARAFRPDVIYERRLSPKIGAAISTLSRKPFVVECNGIPEEEAAMQGRPIQMTPLRRAKAAIRLRLLRRAAAVVAVTPGLRDIVVERFGVSPSRVFVVGNGVDPALFRPLDRAKSRAALGLPAGPLLCFVGNLVRWQGLEGLFDALSTTHEPLDLLLVGDGPDRERLRDSAKRFGILGRVRFVGEVRHALVPLYIAAADACAAPFSSERNSKSGVSALKVVEYIACARPVVVTGVPGATDLVEAYSCGIIVPPEDTGALRLALERVVDDTSYAVAAIRASDAIRDRGSWDHTASAVLKILDGVVRDRTRGAAIRPTDQDRSMHS